MKISSTINDFAKNVFFSYFNKIITVVISFLYTFLIANYLGPEKYGLITYFISFVTGLSGALGFNFLIGTVSNFFPKTKSEKLFKLLLNLILVLSLTTFLFLFFFANQILSFLGRENVDLMQLSSVLILLTPSFTILTSLFQGFKRFGSVLKVVSAESIFNLIFAFLMVVFLQLDIYGVIYSKILSIFIAILFFIFYYRKLSFSKLGIDWKDLRRYWITSAPFSLIRGWEGQSLTIIIGFFIGNFHLGIYYIAQKLASLAVVTPINSLRDVLLPYSLEKSKNNRILGNYVSLNIKFALIISIIFSIILIVVGWPVLKFLFPRFQSAYWLLPLFAIAYILSSFSVLNIIYTATNRLEFATISALVGLFITVISAYFFLLPWFGMYGAVFAENIYAIVNGIMLYFFLKKIKVNVSVIPTVNDIKYFYSIFKSVIFKRK